MNVSGHDAHLGFAGRNDARTVRPNQPRLAFDLEIFIGADHVQARNAFSDADNKWDFGVDSFQQRVSGEHGRNKNYGCVRTSLLFRFRDSIKDGPAFVRGATLARSNPTNNVRAVSRTGLGVERAFTPGNSLDHQPRGFVY